ncbi:hypothetical protein [Streptomyces scabiei]|uniref:hypothetical protein n=1 Tax=Streptomyces scabiei TaxID=1930 RepID=UPI0029B88074|nr:hypothetical protein [Streptomyces scabiei]MDX2794020.1 hypothetical protein [Streptomyces scabiei]
MKRLTDLVAALAVVVLILAGFALTSCDPEAPISVPSIEFDIDSPKRPKAKTPKVPAPKAPAFKAPSTRRR